MNRTSGSKKVAPSARNAEATSSPSDLERGEQS